MTLGVVLGRFQVAALHEGHIALLSAVAARSTRLVVLVGISPAPFNARDPLPFFCRQDAIKTLFPQATVLPMPDCQTDEEWSQQVDKAIKPFEQIDGPITIFGGRESPLPRYTGRYTAEELPIASELSGTEIRKATDLGFSYEFRQGMIYAAQQRFPTSYQAVDIAITRDGKEDLSLIGFGEVTKLREVLLGRKKGENFWRFPGGFVDPADLTLDFAAARELREECGSIEIGRLQFVDSMRIQDWRYRGSVDAVMSALFTAPYLFGNPVAGDDLELVTWSEVSNLSRIIHPAHRSLALALEAHLGLISAVPHR